MAVPTTAELIAQTNPLYEPSRQAIATQMGQVDQQYEGEIAGLQQAKINAFRDITTESNKRGMLFSGYRPQEEARFTGEKFLPAMAAISNAKLTRRNTLTDSLNALNLQQGTTAQGTYLDFLKQENQNAFTAAEAEKDRAFTASQNAASRASSGGGSAKAPKYDVQGNLASMFDGYDPKAKNQKWYTENVVIPTLITEGGLSKTAAKANAYAYRKLTFGQ